jgi:hypothetical protein
MTGDKVSVSLFAWRDDGRGVGRGKVLERIGPLADGQLRGLRSRYQRLVSRSHVTKLTSSPQFTANPLTLFAAPASSQESKKHLSRLTLLRPQTQAGSREFAHLGALAALMQLEPQAENSIVISER